MRLENELFSAAVGSLGRGLAALQTRCATLNLSHLQKLNIRENISKSEREKEGTRC